MLSYEIGFGEKRHSADAMFQLGMQQDEVFELVWKLIKGRVPEENVFFVPVSKDTFKYMTRTITKKEKIAMLLQCINGDITTGEFPRKCMHLTRRKKLQKKLLNNLGEDNWEGAQETYPILLQNEDLVLRWIVSYDKEFKGGAVPKSWMNFVELVKESRSGGGGEETALMSGYREFTCHGLKYQMFNRKVTAIVDTLGKNTKHFGLFVFHYYFFLFVCPFICCTSCFHLWL